MMVLYLLLIVILVSLQYISTGLKICTMKRINVKSQNCNPESISDGNKVEAVEEISSPEIIRLTKKLESLSLTLATIKEEKLSLEKDLAKLDEEYGSEITRIKKEFARMKERSYEEAREAANKAKIDALKEVLPITDNYFRARQLFQPAQNESEDRILGMYDDIFKSFSKVIEDFGVVRIESVGRPFDFNFMEAIMTAPSTEYPVDIVCTEYQVGYKMAEKCIRPAMVVVSTGPGPSSL
jgi:molecular chaperone GrpE